MNTLHFENTYAVLTYLMDQYHHNSREWANLCETRRLLEVEVKILFPNYTFPWSH